MPDFTIYYADGSPVSGRVRNDWRNAPTSGVQAVVEWTAPTLTERRWAHETAPGVWRSVEDRKVWTGDTSYNPFGWGTKTGTLIADAQYRQLAARAMTDPKPGGI